MNENGYFAVNSILLAPLHATLPSAFMCVQNSHICYKSGCDVVESAPAFKCDGYRLKSSLAGYLDKSSVHWGCNSFQFII